MVGDGRWRNPPQPSVPAGHPLRICWEVLERAQLVIEGHGSRKPRFFWSRTENDAWRTRRMEWQRRRQWHEDWRNLGRQTYLRLIDDGHGL